MLEQLKEQVLKANKDLLRRGLVCLTWGNASAIDRSSGLVVIKPSGVSYEAMQLTDLVVVDMEGRVVEGSLRPSSDTPTHLELYRAFPETGGVVHTHSSYATSWSQVGKAIPNIGTTHADTFFADVPCTRSLKKSEVFRDYEKNTGKVIVELFKDINPLDTPAALVRNHGPFIWGKNVAEAVNNATVLEEVAKMAFLSVTLFSVGFMDVVPHVPPMNKYLIDKHFSRKNGPGATYGQETNKGGSK